MRSSANARGSARSVDGPYVLIDCYEGRCHHGHYGDSHSSFVHAVVTHANSGELFKVRNGCIPP